MKLPAHARYKASGVEWLGDIAHHWTVSPIKHLVSTPVTDGPHETPEIFDEGIPFVSAEAVSGGKIEFEKIRGHITAEDHKRFSKKYKPCRGDIYLIKAGATTGRVAMVETDIEFNIWSPLAVIRCEAKLVDRHFLFFYMQSKEFQTAVELSWSFGTQQNIGMGVIQNLAVPLPSLAEQRVIAAFLDRETGRVNRLVAKKRELIERLKEKRTALISSTVTRGLTPGAARAAGFPENPPLKPSGIDWLGDIPKHWELLTWRRLILSLKDFGSNGSFAGLRENVEYLHEPDFAQLIRLTDLRGDLEHEGAIYVSEESFKYLKHSSLKGGEFLIANVGAHAGLVMEMPKIDRPATLGPNMMFAKRIRDDKVTTRYLILSAQSDLIRSQLTMIANASSAQPKLNKDDVRSVVTPLPPLPEQAAIAAYLDEETAKLDALVGKVEEAVERLQEYRTALITAAVTGKVDVRGKTKNPTLSL